MKVLIGVDPHKASLTVTAVDQATGELLERAAFPQDRSGLGALERWAKRFPERRWALENACGLGRHLAGRLAAAGEWVVDVPPKLSARVRVLSTGNARKNDWVDALSTALAASRNERLAQQVDPDAASEVLRLLSERRLLTWSQSAPGCSRQPARVAAGPPPRRGGRETLCRAGSAHSARHTPQGRRLGAPQTALGLGDLARRQDAGQEGHRPEWAHRGRGGSLGHHPHLKIFGIGSILAATIIGAVGNVTRSPSKSHFASYSGTAPLEASSGGSVRHRLSLAGNRHLNYALHMVAVCQARSDIRGAAYYRKKIAEGKSRKEALRCLKRRISDAVFSSLLTDSQAPSRSVA